MAATESFTAKEWVANWINTGPLLEQLRVDTHRKSNLADSLLSLSDASRASLLAYPPKPTSGIIEMQRLFAKFRK